ncbi:MAG TPA: GtrA family protein [Xanthobacteraceae bacterium]|nr:GtrA family protein [Xanthobacteraceae bacterium]
MSAARAWLLDRGGRRPALPAGLRQLGGESIRYLLVSAVALGCDVAVYASLIVSGVMATAAGAAGYVFGMLVHYALSARWVFPDADGSRRTMPTLVKFCATGLIGLATTAAIIDVLTRHEIAGAAAAKAAAVVSAYLVVFILRRAYVFAGGVRPLQRVHSR